MDPRTEKMLFERRQAAEPQAAEPRFAAVRTASSAWLKVPWGRPAVAAVAVAVAGGLALHMLVTQPSTEREQASQATQGREQIESEITARQEVLDACLTSAQTVYTALWDGACKAHRAKKGCALPSRVVADQERRRSDARNDCLQRYALSSR